MGRPTFGDQEENGEKTHLVGAFATKDGLILGQEKVCDKSNEITAIPKLLDILHLKNQIITIDAMGCQKNIAEKILSKKADYVLSLKENHPTLYHETVLYFSDALNKRETYEVKNKSKTDIHIRRCSVTDDVSWVPDLKKWKGLKSLVMIEAIKIKSDTQTKEVRYFISSLEPNPKVILNSVRAHWGIENNLHWILDVVFKEDDRILWDKNVIQNESFIRRFALNLIKQYKTKYNDNTAFKTIRKVLAMDDDKLDQILREF